MTIHLLIIDYKPRLANIDELRERITHELMISSTAAIKNVFIPCKAIQVVFGFWIPLCGFWLLQIRVGFQTLDSELRNCREYSLYYKADKCTFSSQCIMFYTAYFSNKMLKRVIFWLRTIQISDFSVKTGFLIPRLWTSDSRTTKWQFLVYLTWGRNVWTAVKDIRRKSGNCVELQEGHVEERDFH